MKRHQRLRPACSRFLAFVPAIRAKVWWKGENSAARLLKLCLEAGARGDVLRLMGMLGQSFRTKVAYSSTVREWYEGISSVEVAKMLASAVHDHGWDACGTYIQDKLLLQSRVLKEAEYYACMALELKFLGCHDAATSIARRTYALVASCIKSLQPAATAAVASMVFSLLPDQLPAFFAGVQGADIVKVCAMVVKIQDAAANRTLFLKEDPNLLSVFSTLCRMIPANIHHPSVANMANRVIGTFVWLEDQSLLNALLQALLDFFRKSPSQSLLRQLLNDSSLWQQANVSSMGRKVVRSFARERISRLSKTPKPAFTWCQPLASVPNHPEVEAFLKGPLKTLNYSGLNDSRHAGNFARKYFDGIYRNGCSATGKVGYGASCEITKTRAAYDVMVKSWNEDQRELEALPSRIKGIAESPEVKRPKTDYSIILDK